MVSIKRRNWAHSPSIAGTLIAGALVSRLPAKRPTATTHASIATVSLSEPAIPCGSRTSRGPCRSFRARAATWWSKPRSMARARTAPRFIRSSMPWPSSPAMTARAAPSGRSPIRSTSTTACLPQPRRRQFLVRQQPHQPRVHGPQGLDLFAPALAGPGALRRPARRAAGYRGGGSSQRRRLGARYAPERRLRHRAPQRRRGDRGLRRQASVDTGSGDVGLGDMKADVKVDTGSGDVRVASGRGRDHRHRLRRHRSEDRERSHLRGRHRLGQRPRRHGRSGDPDRGHRLGRHPIEGVEVETFKGDTGSGDVTLKSSLAKARDVVVDTGSGSVRIFAGANASFDLEADQGSGDLGWGTRTPSTSATGGRSTAPAAAMARRVFGWTRAAATASSSRRSELNQEIGRVRRRSKVERRLAF